MKKPIVFDKIRRMFSRKEASIYSRFAIPILLMIALSSCAEVQQPTIEEIRNSIPKPLIEPPKGPIYTRKSTVRLVVPSSNLSSVNPATQLIEEINNPRVSILPTGVTTVWEKESLNPFSRKDKLKIEGLKANNKYQVIFAGENCTLWNGQSVCTDTLEKSIEIIYDTLPPTAEVLRFESRNGKLIIYFKNSDNLSGPTKETSQIEINVPGIGNNNIVVNICDKAGNCQDQTLEGIYEPFNKVLNMKKARIEPSGLIVIAGTINDPNQNIDINATNVSVEQSAKIGPFIVPKMALDLDQSKIDCNSPKFDGFNFEVTCKPRVTEGRSTVKVTLVDKTGNKYSESFEVQIPPLKNSNKNMFYSLLVASIVTSSGVWNKVRGSRIQRERRSDLISSFEKKDRQAMQKAKERLVKRDRKGFSHVDEDFERFISLDLAIEENRIVEAIKILKSLYEKPPHVFSDQRNSFLRKLAIKLKGLMHFSNFKELKDQDRADFLNWVLNTHDRKDLEFFWFEIEKHRDLKDKIIAALMIGILKKDVSEFTVKEKFIKNAAIDSLINIVQQMVGWGDFQSAGVLINVVTKNGDVKKTERANYILRLSQSLYLHRIEELLEKTNDVKSFAEKQKYFEQAQALVLDVRFTPDIAVRINLRIQNKEKELALTKSCEERIVDINSSIEELISSSSRGLLLDFEASEMKKSVHEFIVSILPLEVRDLILQRGEWWKYITTKANSPKQVDRMIKTMVLALLMPYKIFFGSNSIDIKFYAKMFSQVINLAEGREIDPETYVFREIWNKVQRYLSAKKASDKTNLPVSDIFSNFDQSLNGKVAFILFEILAKKWSFEFGNDVNISNLVSFYNKL